MDRHGRHLNVKSYSKGIQARESVTPLQLLLDMKVQWGSTYVMLHRADSRKEVCMFASSI
jgi:hypothetical protein